MIRDYRGWERGHISGELVNEVKTETLDKLKAFRPDKITIGIRLHENMKQLMEASIIADQAILKMIKGY